MVEIWLLNRSHPIADKLVAIIKARNGAPYQSQTFRISVPGRPLNKQECGRWLLREIPEFIPGIFDRFNKVSGTVISPFLNRTGGNACCGEIGLACNCNQLTQVGCILWTCPIIASQQFKNYQMVYPGYRHNNLLKHMKWFGLCANLRFDSRGGE